MADVDTIVVGAGVVGAAIAYGLAKAGQRVLALDGEDRDPRAARANFGLVWVQGKGANMPAYRDATRQSAKSWPSFLSDLCTVSGVSVEYRQDGGLNFCLGAAEFERRRRYLCLAGDDAVADPHLKILERDELERLMPKVQLGPEVTGASFCDLDGHANPLQLLHALHAAVCNLDGTIVGGAHVTRIAAVDGGFQVEAAGRIHACAKLIVAAGLGSAAFSEDLGLAIPIRPVRGQILVTERMEPILPLPASGLRQTAVGTVMIGATHEEVGLDTGTNADAATSLSRRALRIVPALADATLVRQWAGLRIMSPDGCPILAQSPTYPGAFAALCHSGVTLAAFFAEDFARQILTGILSPALLPFHPGRFDVRQAA